MVSSGLRTAAELTPRIAWHHPVRCASQQTLAANVSVGSTTAVISALALGPLHLSQPTLAARVSTSRSCHKQTHALQKMAPSLDHLVSAREQLRRHGEAERLRSDQIDDELEFGWLLDRDVGGLRPPQNLVH